MHITYNCLHAHAYTGWCKLLVARVGFVSVYSYAALLLYTHVLYFSVSRVMISAGRFSDQDPVILESKED